MKRIPRRARAQHRKHLYLIEACERRILLNDDGGGDVYGWIIPSENAVEGSATTVQVVGGYTGGFNYDVIWDGAHWNNTTTVPYWMEPIETRPDPVEVSHTFTDSGDYWVMVVTDSNSTNGEIEHVANVAPYATITSTFNDATNTLTTSLINAHDPSSVDTAAGFHYSASTNFFSLASTYATAQSGPSIQLSSQQVGTQTVWIRIFDKDNGYRDYNAVLKVPDLAVVASSSSQTNLTWTDNITGETGWRVQRSTDGVNFSLYAQLPANTNHFEDTGLSAGTTYTYEIRAYGTAGTSNDTGYSPPKSATTLPLPPPTNVQAEDLSAGTALISWVDNSVDESGFVIQWALASGSYDATNQMVVGSSHVVATISDLTAGSQYKFRVAATSGAGQSTWSSDASSTPTSGGTDPAMGTPGLPGSPAVPEGLAGIPSRLTWSANAAMGCVIQRDIDPDFKHPVTTTIPAPVGTAYQFSPAGLKSASAYFFRVKAYNAYGPSDWTATFTVVTSPSGTSTSVISGNRIDFGWTEGIGNTEVVIERQLLDSGEWNGPDPLEEYHVIASLGTGSAPSWHDTTVVGNTHYRYHMSAVYDGAQSSLVGLYDQWTPCATPSDLSISFVNSSWKSYNNGLTVWGSDYNVSWKTTNSVSTRYLMTYSKDNGATWHVAGASGYNIGTFSGNTALRTETISLPWDTTTSATALFRIRATDLAHPASVESNTITLSRPAEPSVTWESGQPPPIPYVGFYTLSWNGNQARITLNNSGTHSVQVVFWPPAGDAVSGVDFSGFPTSVQAPVGFSEIVVNVPAAIDRKFGWMACFRIKGTGDYVCAGSYILLQRIATNYADLDIDSNNTDGSFPSSRATIDEDKIEDDANTPGKIIVANDDASFGNLVPMHLEAFQSDDPFNPGTPLDGMVTLSIISGANQVKVWNSPARSSLLLDATSPQKTWPIGSYPDTVYVEGINPSTGLGDVEFQLSLTATGYDNSGNQVQTTSTDKVRATVVPPTKVEYVTRDPKTGEERVLEDAPYASNPRPEVELTVSDAFITADGLLRVCLTGHVRDYLSELLSKPADRVQLITFTANGHNIGTLNDLINLPGDASASDWRPYPFGGDFDTTFDLSPTFGTNLVIRAETSPNAAGNTGWAEVGVTVQWVTAAEFSPGTGHNPTGAGSFLVGDGATPTEYFPMVVDSQSLGQSESELFEPVMVRVTDYSGAAPDDLHLSLNDGPAQLPLAPDATTPLGVLLGNALSPPKTYYLVHGKEHKRRILVVTLTRLPDDLSCVKSDNISPPEVPTTGTTKFSLYDNHGHVIAGAKISVMPTLLGNSEHPGSANLYWTELELYSCFQVLYGQRGVEFLAYFQNGGNFIESKHFTGNWLLGGWPFGGKLYDVEYFSKLDGRVHIQLESNTDAVSAAQGLFAALRESLKYEPVANSIPMTGDALEAWKARNEVVAAYARDVAKIASEAYMAGIQIACEPASIFVGINDLAEGHWGAAAINLLPFLAPVLLTAVRKTFQITLRGGRTFKIGAAVATALQEARTIPTVADRMAYIEAAAARDGIVLTADARIAIVRSRYFSDILNFDKNTSAVLERNFEVAGRAKPGALFQAHHDLPQEFRQFFAGHGLEIDKAEYGRWINGADGWHQSWSKEFNRQWRQYIADEPAFFQRYGRWYSKDDILAKMRDMQNDLQFAPNPPVH